MGDDIMDFTDFLLDILVVFLATAISSVIFSAFSYSVYVRILFAPLQKSINKVKSKFVYKGGILVLGLVIICIFNGILNNYNNRINGIMMGIFIGLYFAVLGDKKKLEKRLDKTKEK